MAGVRDWDDGDFEGEKVDEEERGGEPMHGEMKRLPDEVTS